MFCTNCGFKEDQDARYCFNCGVPKVLTDEPSGVSANYDVGTSYFTYGRFRISV